MLNDQDQRHLRGAIAALGSVALALTLGVGAGEARQSGSVLARLTMPAGRLPATCELASRPRIQRVLLGAKDQVVMASPDTPIPSNPWRGSEPGVAAAIRRMVDGAPPEPDGPPLDADAAVAFARRWADPVAEAYASTYVEAPQRIGVYAVLFKDASLATPAPPPTARQTAHGVEARMVLGSAVVRVISGASGPCYDAIVSHVRSLQ